jgi:hypothetical protein
MVLIRKGEDRRDENLYAEIDASAASSRAEWRPMRESFTSSSSRFSAGGANHLLDSTKPLLLVLQ